MRMLHHRAVNVTVSLFLLLAIPLIISGCRESTPVETDPTKLACIEMMQKVPIDYEDFEFWDVKALRGDPELNSMYQEWHERRMDWAENLGVNISEVDYVAESEVLTLISGNLSLDEIRDTISINYERNYSYTQAEVWSARPELEPQTTGGAITLSEGLFVWGNDFNIDDYLDVASGKEPSMYDNDTFSLLQKLPEGIEMRIIREVYLEGLVIQGMSVMKEGNGTFRWTNVDMFENAIAATSNKADDYYQDVEDDFKNSQIMAVERGLTFPYSDFTLKRDGEFVEWSVLAEEQAMIGLLFYG